MKSIIEENKDSTLENNQIGEAIGNDLNELEVAQKGFNPMGFISNAETAMTKAAIQASRRINRLRDFDLVSKFKEERGDVPGWVLVVLMTTGLVTAIWTIAAPRLTAILKNSLDAMNGIR